MTKKNCPEIEETLGKGYMTWRFLVYHQQVWLWSEVEAEGLCCCDSIMSKDPKMSDITAPVESLE